ncbi:MAG: spiro-SPASM protein [Spirochaetaceae bacterium]|jgi:spiro-SPASM protein|nr:spiro-SPASM protein [Spirochaetaceae bacterium]
MRALAVLFGGKLTEYAFKPLFGGKSALDLALERAGAFPGVEKRVLLTGPGFDALARTAALRLPGDVALVPGSFATARELLATLAALGAGFGLTYYAWADTPFLDGGIAAALAERHRRYAAEYSYADGWPYGLAPELLAPGVAGVLARLAENARLPLGGAVNRETLFEVIQKDINAFDIEAEISPVDLRQYRLSLAADSKRNTLLLTRLAEAGLAGSTDGAASVERIITERPGLLRTLPAFYAIETASACPQDCAFCPWPASRPEGGENGFMAVERFSALLDKITAFSGDAVIDLSLWGELSLHPEKMRLIEAVLARETLSLIIETSGLGWTEGELEAAADLASRAAWSRRPWLAPAEKLSWVVSLDAAAPARYGAVRGAGFDEAVETAKRLVRLFPDSAYVQALRVAGAEDDIERFYRFWKDAAGEDRIIIQKYDDFAGALPSRKAADLSPVERRPCWHLMRDMCVFIDGRVPRCREDLAAIAPAGGAADGGILGNAFSEDLAAIWERGAACYQSHAGGDYPGICAGCDEYYTFNF